MFKQALQKPILLLWVGILAIRVLFVESVLGHFLKGPWFDFIFSIVRFLNSMYRDRNPLQSA